MVAAIRGTCLCGKVSFEITGKTSEIGQCHCSKCRKVSGTDGNAVLYAAARNFKWVNGEDEIRTYNVTAKSDWQSHFCPTCGSPAPHINKDKKFYFVPAGLLDDDPGHRGYGVHIYVDSKAPWVGITDEAPQYSEGFESRRVDQ